VQGEAVHRAIGEGEQVVGDGQLPAGADMPIA
jgi:hypothetical protein